MASRGISRKMEVRLHGKSSTTMKEIDSLLDRVRNIMRQDTGLNGDAQRIEQLAWMIFLKIVSDKEMDRRDSDPTYIPLLEDRFMWSNWTGVEARKSPAGLPKFIDNELFPGLRNLKKRYKNSDQYPLAHIISEVFGGNNYMKNGKIILKVIDRLNQVDFHKTKDRHDFGILYELMLQELQSAGKSGEFYTPRAITHFIAKITSPMPGEKILDPSCGTGGYLIAALNELKSRDAEHFNFQETAHNLIGWEYKPLPYVLAITNLILHDIDKPRIEFRDSLSRAISNIPPNEKYDLILANPPFGSFVSEDCEKNFPEGYRTKESSILFLQLAMHLLKDGGRAGMVMPDSALTGDGARSRVRMRLLTEFDLHTIIRLPNSVFQPYATVATNLLFFTKGKPTKDLWFYELEVPEGRKSYSKTYPIQYKEFELILDWWHNRNEGPFSWKVSIDELEKNNWNLDMQNPAKEYNFQDTELDEIVKRLEIDLENLIRDFNAFRDELK